MAAGGRPGLPRARHAEPARILWLAQIRPAGVPVHCAKFQEKGSRGRGGGGGVLLPHSPPPPPPRPTICITHLHLIYMHIRDQDAEISAKYKKGHIYYFKGNNKCFCAKSMKISFSYIYILNSSQVLTLYLSFFYEKRYFRGIWLSLFLIFFFKFFCFFC